MARDKPTRRADALADRLRAGMNEVLARREVAGLVYGESSVFHVFLEPPDATTRVARREDYTWLDAATLKGMAPHLVQALQAAFRVRGVELCVGNGGGTSAVHAERISTSPSRPSTT